MIDLFIAYMNSSGLFENITRKVLLFLFFLDFLYLFYLSNLGLF